MHHVNFHLSEGFFIDCIVRGGRSVWVIDYYGLWGIFVLGRGTALLGRSSLGILFRVCFTSGGLATTSSCSLSLLSFQGLFLCQSLLFSFFFYLG
jgi:hypothetical protein